jgi:hypothetical protein
MVRPALEKLSGEFFLVFLSFLVLGAAVCGYILPEYAGEPRSYRLEWVLCSRYIDQGILYNSGTPYCVQAPLLHYTVWALIKTVGLGNLDKVLFSLTALSSAAAYMLLKRILDEEGLVYNRWLYAAVYALTVAEISVTYFETILSTVFLLAGFIALYYRKSGRRELWGAAFLSLSVMSKILAAPLVAIICAHYVLRRSGNHVRALLVPAGISAMLLAVILRLPGVLDYAYFVHMMAPARAMTLSELAYALSPFHPLFTKQHILLYALTAYLGWVLYRRRDLFALLAASYVPYAIRHPITGGIEVIPMLYYSIPFNVFIIFCLLRERGHVKPGGGGDFASILVIVLFAAYGSHLYRLNPLSQNTPDPGPAELDFGISFLPKDVGTVVTGYWNRFPLRDSLSAAGSDISAYKIAYLRDIPEKYGIDSPVGLRMKAMGTVSEIGAGGQENITPEEAEMFRDETAGNGEIVRGIRDGAYAAVILSPPDFLGLMRLQGSGGLAAYACTVTLPNAYYRGGLGADTTVVFFKDVDKCQTMKAQAEKYYAARFDSICGKSREAAMLLMNVVFPKNGWGMFRDVSGCGVEGDYMGEGNIEPWPITPREHANARDLLILAAAAATMTAARGAKLTKGMPQKSQKRPQRRRE